MNILFYVQHLLGIGHDRRAAAISRGLIAAGHRVVVLRGGFPDPGADYGLAEIVQLAPVRAADASFAILVDGEGRPIDETWRVGRRQAVMEAFYNVSPDILLVESYPFARGTFAFELDPLLETAREENVTTVASVRDILVAKARPDWADGVADIVERLFDGVLVHGDPDLAPFAATFPAAARLRTRVHHTGYIAPAVIPAPADGDGRDEVVVSVGGGAVGLPLLRAALTARPLSPLAKATWRLLVGPDLDDTVLAQLRRAAADGVIVERARRDFPDLLARCRLSISQAGYNTVLDVLQAGCPAVLVPFARGRETEQAIRAHLLSEKGRVAVVEEASLNGAALAEGIARALALPPSALTVRLDGVRDTVAQLEALWRPPTWTDLRTELDRWADAGQVATFWWRDDDVEKPSPDFNRLLSLSTTWKVPVTLAAIPATVEPAVVPMLAPDTYVLQHGHTHAPYRAADGWVYEFCDEQPAEPIIATMAADRRRLVDLFGTRALPVMVPPWNRFGAKLAHALPGIGLVGLSTFRHRRFNVPGMHEFNTHIDPIAWRYGQKFAGDGPALNGATAHLRSRRLGVRPHEPTGLLTHHLQMTDESWDFVARLFAATVDHPAVRWLDGAAVFGANGPQR